MISEEVWIPLDTLVLGEKIKAALMTDDVEPLALLSNSGVAQVTGDRIDLSGDDDPPPTAPAGAGRPVGGIASTRCCSTRIRRDNPTRN